MESNGGPAVDFHASRSPHWSYILLTAIIIALSSVVALLLLPFFLQNYTPQKVDPFSCSPQLYTGSQCLLELQNWQSCLPQRQNDTNYDDTIVYIPSDSDQALREEQAHFLFTGLQLLGASEECVREFKSFWCLLLFGVCDSNGQKRLPSFDMCQQLQTHTCADIITIATDVPDFSVLVQNCNNFRLSNPPCETETDWKMKTQTSFNVTCSDNFYYDEESLVCRPKCGEWTHFTPEMAIAMDILTIAGDVLSIVICSAILLLSVFQYKRMFTFPSVLMLYPTVLILVFACLDLSTFPLIDSLLCSSVDLIENITYGESSTPLCKLSGGLFHYTALVISLFWLFQTVIFVWVALYPVHYRSVNSTRSMKYIHMLGVAVCFTFPVIPLVPVQFKNGIGINAILPKKCTLLSADIVFYGIVLPIDVIVILGISLLVITLWSIADVKNRLQKKPSLGRSRVKSSVVKLILMIIHYLLVGFYTLTAANITLKNFPAHEKMLSNHFLCEALGDKDTQCSREGFGQLQQDSFIQIFVYSWFNIYPSIFLIFIISRKSRKISRKRKVYTTSTSAASQETTSTSAAS